MKGDQMRRLKDQELALMTKICRKYDLPMNLFKSLNKSAVDFTYNNAGQSQRKKEYMDLISYHCKKSKGDS